jgi:tripartite-type tricarboxylate transporter receptor subunit TctC
MKTALKLKLLLLAIGASALLPFGAQAADNYPSRPITIIVPFSPGGPGDITARFVAEGMQKELGQPIVIENKPGANGVMAANVAASEAADGYKILQISSSHTVNESLVPGRAYKLMRDFEPLASLNFTEMVLMVKNDLPVKNVPELIAYAKAHPGKLNYASSGVGSSYHMAGELLKTMAGISINHVPYKAAATARSDIIGGHIDMMFDALPAALELVRTGKVKGLATTAKARSKVLPDVPTVGETLKGFENTIFIGLVAPKKTPPEIVAKLHKAINAVLAKPETEVAMRKLGGQPFIMSREEFVKFLNDDIAQGERLVKISGAKVD